MNGFQHIGVGIVSSIGLSTGICMAGGDIWTGMAAMPLCIVGSLIPDIDQTQSTIGKALPFLSKQISKLGHRTYTHSVLLWVVLGVLCYFKLPLWVMGLFVGVASHLLLDAMTIHGIPLYCLGTKENKWNRHFHILPKFMRCRGGSFWSHILCIMFSILPFVVMSVI